MEREALENLPSGDVLRQAVELCKATADIGISFRLFGSCAVRIKCILRPEILDHANRVPKDIDGIVLMEDRNRLRTLLRQRGWEEDCELTAQTDGQRLRFELRSDRTDMDLCVDALRFAQTLCLRDRLKMDWPTIPVADLLLSKLQVPDLTEGDISDILSLIWAFPSDEQTAFEMEFKRIADIAGKSWGWYRSVNRSLRRLNKALRENRAYLSPPDRALLSSRLQLIASMIESTPKTYQWRIRAFFGESFRWYTHVEPRPSN